MVFGFGLILRMPLPSKNFSKKYYPLITSSFTSLPYCLSGGGCSQTQHMAVLLLESNLAVDPHLKQSWQHCLEV